MVYGRSSKLFHMSGLRREIRSTKGRRGLLFSVGQIPANSREQDFQSYSWLACVHCTWRWCLQSRSCEIGDDEFKHVEVVLFIILWDDILFYSETSL